MRELDLHQPDVAVADQARPVAAFAHDHPMHQRFRQIIGLGMGRDQRVVLRCARAPARFAETAMPRWRSSHAKKRGDFIKVALVSSEWRDCDFTPFVATPADVAKFRHSRAPFAAHSASRIYQELCPGVLRSAGNFRSRKRADADDDVRNPSPAEAASPMRGLLPLWVGAGVYAVFMLAGNRLLIDPDTMWQITDRPVDRRSSARCRRPTSIPSPCAASPGSRRSGWRRSPTRRPMRSPAGPGRWCWPRPHRRDLRAVRAISDAALEREHRRWCSSRRRWR